MSHTNSDVEVEEEKVVTTPPKNEKEKKVRTPKAPKKEKSDDETEDAPPATPPKKEKKVRTPKAPKKEKSDDETEDAPPATPPKKEKKVRTPKAPKKEKSDDDTEDAPPATPPKKEKKVSAPDAPKKPRKVHKDKASEYDEGYTKTEDGVDYIVKNKKWAVVKPPKVKRAPTAYSMFLSMKMKDLRLENPNEKSTYYMKQAGEIWKTLTPEEKATYKPE